MTADRMTQTEGIKTADTEQAPKEETAKTERENMEKNSSIDKAFILLDALAKNNCPMTLKELSVVLCAPKSTTHGILAQLVRHNAIVQNVFTGKYELGMHMLELGNLYIRSLNIVDIAQPLMQKIADHVGMNVHLCKLEYPYAVLVAAALPKNAKFKMTIEPGTQMPLFNNAGGRLFLAHMKDTYLKKYIQETELRRYTSRSITDREKFRKAIETVRKNGYGEEHNERNIGMHGIAFPVYNANGDMVYAFAVHGVSNKKEDGDIPRMIDAARTGARDLSTRLGFSMPAQKPQI